MLNKEKIIDAVASLLAEQAPPTEETLRKIVESQIATARFTQKNEINFSKEEINDIIKTLQTRFDTRMGVGQLFVGENYHPWLAATKENIDFYYWKRYEKRLNSKFAPDVVLKLDTHGCLIISY